MTTKEKKLLPTIKRLLRKLRPGGDIHRDDLVEGLVTEDNIHADSFSDDEKKLLKNILILRQRSVEDVMVRRAQISAIDISSSIDDISHAFQTTNRSRLPVYRETLDHPIGILHIKDMLKYLTGNHRKNFNLGKIVHPPLFVPPSMQVTDLLRKMQDKRLHMALVIDEHGGTSGLVSIEDLVEEIVGKIEDEHEKQKHTGKGFIKRRDGSFEVNAHIPLMELKKITGEDFNEEETAAQTLGGLATALSGRLPQKGDRVITSSGTVLEIRSANPRRVQTIRIYPQKTTMKTKTASILKTAQHQ